MYPSVCLSVCLSICPFVHLSVSLAVRPSVSLSVCPSFSPGYGGQNELTRTQETSSVPGTILYFHLTAMIIARFVPSFIQIYAAVSAQWCDTLCFLIMCHYDGCVCVCDPICDRAFDRFCSLPTHTSSFRLSLTFSDFLHKNRNKVRKEIIYSF